MKPSMSTRTIAYLTSEYPKISHTFIQREVAGLRANGLEIDTFSIREPSSDDLRGDAEQSEHQTTTYIFPTLKKPIPLLQAHLSQLVRAPALYLGALVSAVRDRPAGLKSLIYQLAYFAEAGILADHLKSRSIAHLHAHFANSGCTVAMLASQMADVPFSFTMHGPTEFFDVEKFSLRKKLSKARFVCCISHFCRSQLMLFSDKSDWEKFHIIHCAVDPDDFSASPSRDENNLLFVGRMSGVKGVPLLLEAVARVAADIPDLSVTLVGDGEERPELEAQARSLGVADRVLFAGYQSQAEVSGHMANAGVFVLPSFAEGLPVVLMEALASQTPVVTTRIAGVSELVIDGKTGVLIAPGDVDGLADALREIFGDQKARKSMGKAGRAKVSSDFNIQIETQKLAQLFKQYGGK